MKMEKIYAAEVLALVNRYQGKNVNSVQLFQWDIRGKVVRGFF